VYRDCLPALSDHHQTGIWMRVMVISTDTDVIVTSCRGPDQKTCVYADDWLHPANKRHAAKKLRII